MIVCARSVSPPDCKTADLLSTAVGEWYSKVKIAFRKVRDYSFFHEMGCIRTRLPNGDEDVSAKRFEIPSKATVDK